MHIGCSLTLLSLFLSGGLLAQTDGSLAPVQEVYQGNWFAPAGSRSLGNLEIESTGTVDDAVTLSAEARYKTFRSEQLEGLAAGRGVLDEGTRSGLAAHVRQLDAMAPGSFEAHMAHFHLELPAVSAFAHLQAAKAVAPGSKELLGPVLLDAIRSGDRKQLIAAAARFTKEGGVAPGLWKYADDVVRCLDPGSIVITAGEMDGYPLAARTASDGYLIVDSRLLGDANYRTLVWKEASASGPTPDQGPAFAHALARATSRPVHLSLGLPLAWFQLDPEHLQLTGLTYVIRTTPVDLSTLQQRWSAMDRSAKAGPLSWNYLLSGSVLLEHYRAIDNETGSARTTHELRVLAEKIGAVKALDQNQVFTH